jgi:hypothetical protein
MIFSCLSKRHETDIVLFPNAESRDLFGVRVKKWGHPTPRQGGFAPCTPTTHVLP